MNVNPTVFHPGLFYSTKFLLEFLSDRTLSNTRILELGAGTGLLSVYCAKQRALVTATDISKNALVNIKQNAELNHVSLNIIHSDLFANVSPNDFDTIIVNPPYYPKKVQSERDYAWFCGENFDYFGQLFLQIKQNRNVKNEIIMVLSEDCNISKIKSIAAQYGLSLSVVLHKRIFGEGNYIFSIH